MNKKQITGSLVAALVVIAGALVVNTDEVIVPVDKILETDFDSTELPSTEILPCTKVEDGINCEYYISTVQPNTGVDGIFYETVNVRGGVFLSAKSYNKCRETKTEAVCKDEQNQEVQDRMAHAEEREREGLKQLQNRLAEEKALEAQTTDFNLELDASDITI